MEKTNEELANEFRETYDKLRNLLIALGDRDIRVSFCKAEPCYVYDETPNLSPYMIRKHKIGDITKVVSTTFQY